MRSQSSDRPFGSESVADSLRAAEASIYGEGYDVTQHPLHAEIKAGLISGKLTPEDAIKLVEKFYTRHAAVA